MFTSLLPTLFLLIVAVFVINYNLECFVNLGIAYIYHSTHQLFEYKLVLGFFFFFFLIGGLNIHLCLTFTYLLYGSYQQIFKSCRENIQLFSNWFEKKFHSQSISQASSQAFNGSLMPTSNLTEKQVMESKEGLIEG